MSSAPLWGVPPIRLRRVWAGLSYWLPDRRPNSASPPHGGPRSTRQLHSRMCSTIAAATMSRSGVCEGLLFSADLEPQRKARTSLRNSSVTVGQGMGAVENKERTEVKVPDREPNGPLSVLSWRYSLHADANCFPGVRICGLP
jgi:hypothetical protein